MKEGGIVINMIRASSYRDYDGLIHVEELVRQVPYYVGVVKMKNHPLKKVVRLETYGLEVVYYNSYTFVRQDKPVTRKLMCQNASGGLAESNMSFSYY